MNYTNRQYLVKLKIADRRYRRAKKIEQLKTGVLRGVFSLMMLTLIFAFIDAHNSNKGQITKDYLKPVVKIYTIEEIRIEKLENSLKDANNKLLQFTSSSYTTEYDSIFQKYFGSEWKKARAIAKAESGLNCKAVQDTLNLDGSVDYGLMQINSRAQGHRVNHDYEKLLDCEANIKIAKDIYVGRGNSFSAWVAYTNGSWVKYYN